MLDHKLLLADGILVLEPKAPLEAADFAAVASKVDPYIAEHGSLPGLLLHARSFPGWVDLEAALAHVRFIESHHRKVQRVAVVSDSPLLAQAPKLVAHLVYPEIKHFAESAYEDALSWLRQEPPRQRTGT